MLDLLNVMLYRIAVVAGRCVASALLLHLMLRLSQFFFNALPNK